ncbi:hypothetical protein BCR34DRAFT_261635 [Clohesyomyces aquaticus]|uniref:Uncharacterized protein n=1 Tax=Clohesyomyces aquaticus TaxID=1231657 RepID=A0A1Y1ZTI9_9PLEO|nr:hypothetical protein BCR34DRAFT_261635 [Clohesyomyces aquaticus]
MNVPGRNSRDQRLEKFPHCISLDMDGRKLSSLEILDSPLSGCSGVRHKLLLHVQRGVELQSISYSPYSPVCFLLSTLVGLVEMESWDYFSYGWACAYHLRISIYLCQLRCSFIWISMCFFSLSISYCQGRCERMGYIISCILRTDGRGRDQWWGGMAECVVDVF